MAGAKADPETETIDAGEVDEAGAQLLKQRLFGREKRTSATSARRTSSKGNLQSFPTKSPRPPRRPIGSVLVLANPVCVPAVPASISHELRSMFWHAITSHSRVQKGTSSQIRKRGATMRHDPANMHVNITESLVDAGTGIPLIFTDFTLIVLLDFGGSFEPRIAWLTTTKYYHSLRSDSAALLCTQLEEEGIAKSSLDGTWGSTV